MQIRTLTVEFPALRLSDFQPLPPNQTGDDVFPRSTPTVGLGIGNPADFQVEFDTPPSQVAAVLSGFRVWFETDRPFGNLEVRVGNPQQTDSDTIFFVPVTFGLRDWSGDWDDRHGAVVRVTVIGD